MKRIPDIVGVKNGGKIVSKSIGHEFGQEMNFIMCALVYEGCVRNSTIRDEKRDQHIL